MSSAVQKQHQKILRNLMKIPSNKKCADCGEQCAVNVDVTHGIFICTNCSGIHREFGHRIKSVSMATFTQEEINTLQSTNNEEFNNAWMAKWKPEDMALPLNADDERRRDFLRAKYEDKKWFSKTAAMRAKKAPSSAEPAAEAGGEAVAAPVQPAAPVSKPQAAKPQAAWSPFDNPAPAGGQVVSGAGQAAKGARAANDLDDLLNFGASPAAAQAANQRQEQQAKHDDLKGLVDLMGPPVSGSGFGQPQGGFNQGGARPAAPQGGFGQPQGGFGQPQGGFGQPQGGFGQPQGGFGQPQGGFNQGGARPAAPQGGFGQPQGGFGQPQGGFGQPQGGFGQPMGGFNQGGARPAAPQGGFGQPQGGFGQPMGGFGQPSAPSNQAKPAAKSGFDDLGLF